MAETESGLPSPPPEAAGPCDRPPDRLSLLRQREHVLGRSLDVGLGLLGAAFLLSSLGRILGIGGGEATSAQIVLAGFGLVLIGFAAWHVGSRMVGALLPPPIVLVKRKQEVAECLFALGVLLHACRCYLRWAPRTPAVSLGRT